MLVEAGQACIQDHLRGEARLNIADAGVGNYSGHPDWRRWSPTAGLTVKLGGMTFGTGIIASEHKDHCVP